MTDCIRQLIDKLNEASYAYYNGKELIMDDAEFDYSLNKLKKLEEETHLVYSDSPTQRVGAPILNSLKKVDISDRPMLSLDKCHSKEEIIKFAKGQDLIASIKCDGLSVRIIYENGVIKSANTRGNGYIGQDVTEHIKHFINIPLSIPVKEKITVDGEAVIFWSDFKEIGDYKTPRNLASGTLACLDTSLCTTRKLRFIAWDLFDFKDMNLSSYGDKLEILYNLGFSIVWNDYVTPNDDYIEVAKKLVDKNKEIPCDGIVFKYDDCFFDTTKTAKFFNNAIAYKFEDVSYETTLEYIDWTLSRNGILTPVAVFKPVEINGATITRASLHNVSIMQEIMGDFIYQNQPIKVYLANMIIPQILSAEKIEDSNKMSRNKGIHITKTYIEDFQLNHIKCPYCGEESYLEISPNNVKILSCKNPHCCGKLSNKIDHFCSKKGMDIKGLSLATIEKLIDKKWLRDITSIYALEAYKPYWTQMEGFGVKSVDNILNAIEESKNCYLENFISALGIPLIGLNVAKEIVKYYPTWSDFRDAVGGKWSDLEGFGPEMEKAINNFNYVEADKIAAILTFKKHEVQVKDSSANTAAGLNFVITGKLSKPRNQIQKDIEEKGGKVIGSVSTKTNYLVCNDKNSNSAKSVKAKSIGVPIISEQELEELLGKKD